MTYFVIIRGPLGVGKTEVSKKLAKLLRAEYISMDSVLRKNRLDKVEAKRISASNFIKANSIIARERGRVIKQKPIVIDGNFYYKIQIYDLGKKLKAPYYVFTLKASLDTCIGRDSKRKRKYGNDATRAVHNLVSKFDYGIVIDAEHNSSRQIAEEILTCLRKCI